MSINFFDVRCQEAPLSDSRFGLCDNQNKKKAFTNTHDPNTWVAIVDNKDGQPVTFTAVDNCVKILRADGNLERHCDGMLTYTDNIVFIELKDVEKAWISDAIEQLEITIRYFTENHDTHLFRHKRAFACNKKHPRFKVIEPETKKRFFDTYRVRLNIQAIIKI